MAIISKAGGHREWWKGCIGDRVRSHRGAGFVCVMGGEGEVRKGCEVR